MPDRTRPRYVARTHEQAFAPPYRQDGCALFTFALPADRPRLQRVVDRFLTGPSGGRVRPRVAADRALLYFCDFARSHSLHPVDARRGWLGEREFGVWIPIQVVGIDAPTFFAQTMIVDSGPAMCSGREVLGFPKEIGAIQVARAPERAACLSVDVLATEGGRSGPGSWRPLVDFERIEGDGPPASAGVRGLARAAAAAIEGAGELLGVGVGEGEDVSKVRPSRIFTTLAALARAGRGRAEFLSLKQLRDAAAPELACYQSVVQASARLTRLGRLAAAGEYAYRIHPRASHPLVDELGLAAEGRVGGVFCELDLDFEAVEETPCAP